MKERKTFWDKNAGRYDRFMRKDRAAYEEMYKLIRPVVKAKTVLELATGTGLIAKHIVNAAAHIEATDASAEMIAEAKRDNHSAKLHFSVQDMFRLPYADKSFDVVIVSNALHIVPQPEKALQEISCGACGENQGYDRGRNLCCIGGQFRSFWFLLHLSQRRAG